ncbi:MAG: ATP-dependent helicase, partial [Actinomycetota bacterium]|nr:ATP-dependent helicase [Actinomycetota bacterium]
MASALDDLDPSQLAAVTTPSRLVAVLAGAGTGKTRVLTRRIAWRVDEGDADARHTLALTFTREAAGELRRRLRRLGLREQITSGTFHAVMLAMLRQRATDHGRPAPQIVASRHRLLKEIGTGRQTDAVAFEADWCGARGIRPDDYVHTARTSGRRSSAPPEEMARLLGAYAVEKRRRGVIDINDVLVESLLLLEREPAFADALRWRFRHVLIDEAQDLNPVQHRLIGVLRSGVDDLYMVGDPAQAIYGFNGADPALLVDVGDRFPGIEIVRLGANHRCTPQVVAFGRHVLCTAGQPTDITSTRYDGPAVTAQVAADERQELELIGDLLDALDPSLLRSSDAAVLARTNAQVSRLRSALDARGIP